LDCTEAGSCASNVAGTYTVTGTNGATTGTATLTITAIPVVDLPDFVPSASAPLFGVPTSSYPSEFFTVTAAGFAPNAPVTFGIYSTPFVLGHAIADGRGTAVVQLQIPAGFAGTHTVLAAGVDPSLTPMYLSAKVMVLPAPQPEGPTADPLLSITGSGISPIGLGVMAFLLLGLGSFAGIAASRRGRRPGSAK
jgi:hypothetical protein